MTQAWRLLFPDSTTTVFHSRSTGIRWTVRDMFNGDSAYFREGVLIRRVSTRTWALIAIEAADRREALALAHPHTRARK